MLLLAIYFACGVALDWYQLIGTLGAIVLTTIFIACWLLSRNSALYVLPLVFISLGIICGEIESRSVTDERIRQIYDKGRIESGEPVEIEGMLVGFPDPAYGGSFLKVRVDRLGYGLDEMPAEGDVRLFLVDSESPGIRDFDLSHGSRVRIACRLEREERFLNPGVASAREALDRQAIDAVGIVKSPMLVEKLGDERVYLPLMWAYRSRLYMIEKFRSTFSAETSGVMIASLLGDDNFLDRRTADSFRDGGTFHVLVISGLHITFIGGLALWLTSYFTRRILVRSIFATSFLWAYTFAVGAEIPVVRASIMFSFLLLARIIYRNGSLLNALGACTLALLVWRPSDLFSPSFQLTLVSVAAIVGCSFPLIEKFRAIGGWHPNADEPLPPNVPRLIRRIAETLYWSEDAWRIENRRHNWSAKLYKSPYLAGITAPNVRLIVAYVFEGLLVSLIVQIWMLPLLIVYFHRLSPPGLFLNLWVGTFLALESFAAIAAVLIGAVNGWLAAPVVALTELLNGLMISLPSIFSDFGIAGSRIPVYSGGLRVIYPIYCVILALSSAWLFNWNPFALIRRNGRRFAIAGFAATAGVGLVMVLHPFSSPPPDGLLKLEFLDVGQGDSALITFPDGQTMLIDGGGKPDYRDYEEGEFDPDISRIGERVVSEFLWEKGYSRIDHVLATHADADHMQGLTDVLRNFSVGTLYVGASPTNDRDFNELLSLAQRDRVPMRLLVRGDELNIAGVELRVLNPISAEDASRSRSENDSSIVLNLAYGSRSFLMTGDIERVAEAGLVEVDGLSLRTDVVKVAHHGSRTSSTAAFIEKAEAEVAVVSVGRRSRFGHPHGEVTRRWIDSGADVLITGARGTITIETDGENLAIRTFVP